ncbi:hypothetical protein JCM8115_000274 [Rhodotorula mucilaginosa]
MSIQACKAALLDAIDDLLSVRSSPARQTAALANLEAVVARLAVDPAAPPLADAFLRWQDSPSRNVAATLLEWLGRLVVRNDLSAESLLRENIGSDVLRCLRLLQGVLLLHRPSQHFFARKATHEILLALLELARPNNPNTPLLGTPKPQPSPVLFPPTPAASPSLPSEAYSAPAQAELPTQLALAVLDTLLCGLVDHPKNMRTFESVGGLGAIVRVLKDKSVSQAVRIKVIEMLFFYLMPEATPSASSSSDLNPLAASHAATPTLDSNVLAHPEQLPDLLSGAADFIPQTPVKSRVRPPPASSSRERRESPAQSSREGSPTRSPRLSKRADPSPSDWLPETTPPRGHHAGHHGDTLERRRTPCTPRGRRATAVRPEKSQDAPATQAEVTRSPIRSTSGHRRTQSAVADGTLPNLRPPASGERSSSSSLDRTSEVVRTDMPPPPRPSSVRHASSTVRRTVSQPSAPQPVNPPSTPRAAREGAGAGHRFQSRSPYVRSRSEKKELLRQVMPNVDALEARFKAMGLEL